MSEEERTKDLREHLVGELGSASKAHSNFSEKTENNVERIDTSKNQLHECVNRIDKDLSEFKNYCDSMAK